MSIVARGTPLLERAIRQDRIIALAGVAALTLLAWIYLLRMAAAMHAGAMEADMHAAMGMPSMRQWGGTDLLVLFLMWSVMMVAMMLPSAAPVLLLVVSTYRRRGVRAVPLSATFLSGYIAVWLVFSAAAALAQLALHRGALLTPAMVANSTLLGGAILLGAGLYQLLPLKAACLTNCRSPIQFLTHEWREGFAGAVVMGARHGVYCVGCCWALMAVLLVAGVMNLLWVGAIAAFVLVEKAAPGGPAAGKAAGALLLVWGTWLLARSLA